MVVKSSTKVRKSLTADSVVSRQPSTVNDQPTRSFIKAIFAIVWKDLRAEFRSFEIFLAMLVFSLIIIVIFNFALDLNISLRQSVTAGVLWTTFAFAGTLGLNRSMAIEKDQGGIDGLLLAPVDRSAIYFGKLISNLAFMLMVEIIILPIYSILYNTNLLLPELLLIILLGSIGYAGVGTLLSAMSVQTRTRDILLPILMLPVVLPLVIAAVQASNGVLTGSDFSKFKSWFNLLLAYDIILIAAAFMLFDFILED